MSSEKIGRYQVKSELGRGGMATVYHAYDPSFERDVAIKVLPPAFLHDPQFRVRFEREAKTIALLEHPAIVPVYDFGEQDGQPYIVMRYMAGGSLADQLQQGAMPLDETSRIITRLAPALDAAHARGIIHRDLKPGNILFDQYGNAFLSDFGIARLAQASGTTITGDSIVGTPAYMSPEQVQGDKKIDGRSDIYAMGVLIYQMLTGQTPYQADTPAKVMLMHILEPVPHILDRKTDLPAGCEEVIRHAMAKVPEDRFSTTAELSEALETLTHGDQPVQKIEIPQDDQTLVSDPTGQASLKTAVSTGQARANAAATVMTPSKPLTAPPQAIPAAPPRAKRSPILLIAIIGLIIVCGMAGGGLFWLGRQGSGPLAMLAAAPATATQRATFTAPSPSDTPQPAATTSLPVAVANTPTLPPPTPSAAPTETPLPTETPTPEPQAVVLGGADKVAFLSGGNIWAANLDGTQLQQLTEDGTEKSSLQWTPDGQALIYISAKCVQKVGLEGGPVETIVCFTFTDSLKSFDISPDGKQVAITIDNQLYIVDYDLARLQQVSTRTQLTDMAACKDFAPYLRNFVTQVRWSRDSTAIAAKLIANLGNGIQGDVVQLFRVDRCIPDPRAMDNFPPPRFEMRGYDKNPVIQNFSWDGEYLFALNTIVRNDGFGDLFIYNTNLHKVYPSVNPVNNVCCYRDPQWSPDGTYLIFAFQDYLQGSNSNTQLYYIPYGSIGSGAQYTPLPVPSISDPREKPQPVLRPAR